MTERNTSPDEAGWYDATQVQPYAIHDDICESNPVLGKTSEGRILLVNFRSEGWDEDDGAWMYPPDFGLESESLTDQIIQWKPLPDSHFEPQKPWVGTDKSPYSKNAPKIQFWHEQQLIGKAEEEAEQSDDLPALAKEANGNFAERILLQLGDKPDPEVLANIFTVASDEEQRELVERMTVEQKDGLRTVLIGRKKGLVELMRSSPASSKLVDELWEIEKKIAAQDKTFVGLTL